VISCPVCSSFKNNIIYTGYLRTGTFGKYTQEKHNVYSCSDCNTKFIQNTLADDYYKTSDYREDYNNNVDITNFYKENDTIDTNKITKIGLKSLRDKVVADFGTGAGTFLQAIDNISKFTIAIEPTEYFHEILNKNSKYVFSYAKELLNNNIKVDVATSFDVIEHVPSPLGYLNEIYKSLNSGGKLYLKTPNFDDILHELIPESFDSFNYRTAHLFYFDKNSIEYLLKKAGFENYKISYIHEYDISNLLLWMKDSKPTGLNKVKLFDNGFNLIYKDYLEKSAKASHLWIEAVK
jgi:2-polyprenyl-3-methyl-5-hydroxy-6-metoxy-1,4-benzoquinol methylase